MISSSYDRVAPFYDRLRWCYGLGQMEACSEASAALAAPGTRVLLAGCGTAREAQALVKRGAYVSLLDRSAAMLQRARTRLAVPPEANSESAFSVSDPARLRFVHADIEDLDLSTQFDGIVANFFLNVFDDQRMPRVLEKLVQLVVPGGWLAIGDFAPLRGGRVRRGLQWTHHALPMAAFGWLTGNPLHRVHDYRAALSGLEATVERAQRFRAFGWGPRWYELLVARRSHRNCETAS